MRQRISKMILFVSFLFVSLLASCTHPTSPPMLASWPEQYAAAEECVKDLEGEFVLAQASALPIRVESGDPDEPIELSVFLIFENPNPTSTVGKYATQLIGYHDYHLTTTLYCGDVVLRASAPDPAVLKHASILQIGPQDALQLTLVTGEAYMGKAIEKGNTNISLVWDVSEDHPELKNVSVWHITYSREGVQLHILVDTQTGAILKSYEGQW